MSNNAKHAKLLLNKVINEDDVKALTRYNIVLDDMPTDTDRNAYEFIEQYAHDNGGKAPSYAAISDQVDGFEYIPEVTDSFSWLAKGVKGFAAKQAVIHLFETGEFERKLNELDGNKFIEEWLPNYLDYVSMRTAVRERVGTDIKTGADKFLEEYERRKAGESFKLWKSKFSAIGEYVSGNMYTLFGESGRGKSVFALEDAINIAVQGGNVLVWAMEMAMYEVFVRIYTSLSGDARMTKTLYDGQEIEAGFTARDIRTGSMEGDIEDAFKEFVAHINDHVDGNITVRAVDDEDFTDRSLKALKTDIDRTNADYVLIDPFYYMQYERNANKTTGGAAAETSMKLRALAGNMDVVIVALTQADDQKSDINETELRELTLPNRKDVKKASNLLEDAAILIGVDSDYKQGIGIVGVLKGRDGGEGDISNVQYLPQFGIVKELEVGEEAMQGFDF